MFHSKNYKIYLNAIFIFCSFIPLNEAFIYIGLSSQTTGGSLLQNADDLLSRVYSLKELSNELFYKNLRPGFSTRQNLHDNRKECSSIRQQYENNFNIYNHKFVSVLTNIPYRRRNFLSKNFYHPALFSIPNVRHFPSESSSFGGNRNGLGDNSHILDAYYFKEEEIVFDPTAHTHTNISDAESELYQRDRLTFISERDKAQIVLKNSTKWSSRKAEPLRAFFDYRCALLHISARKALKKGKIDIARNFYKLFLYEWSGDRLDTSIVHTYFLLALLEQKANNIKEARSLFNEGTALFPHPRLLQGWALLESKYGSIERAKELVNQAVRRDPSFYPLLKWKIFKIDEKEINS